MGILAGIKSFLGFANTNSLATNLASDLSSGVDKIFYTAEEKADNQMKVFESWLNMVQVMKNSEVYRSVTRRLLAVGIVFNLLLMIWLCVVCELVNSFGWVTMHTAKVDKVEFTTATWSILKIASVFELGWVFCTIIVFYFGPQLIQQLTGGKK